MARVCFADINNHHKRHYPLDDFLPNHFTHSGIPDDFDDFIPAELFDDLLEHHLGPNLDDLGPVIDKMANEMDKLDNLVERDILNKPLNDKTLLKVTNDVQKMLQDDFKDILPAGFPMPLLGPNGTKSFLPLNGMLPFHLGPDAAIFTQPHDAHKGGSLFRVANDPILGAMTIEIHSTEEHTSTGPAPRDTHAPIPVHAFHPGQPDGLATDQQVKSELPAHAPIRVHAFHPGQPDGLAAGLKSELPGQFRLSIPEGVRAGTIVRVHAPKHSVIKFHNAAMPPLKQPSIMDSKIVRYAIVGASIIVCVAVLILVGILGRKLVGKCLAGREGSFSSALGFRRVSCEQPLLPEQDTVGVLVQPLNGEPVPAQQL
eukprot:644079_1